MDNDTQRGTKRKRYEPPHEELSVRIRRKLHHEIKEVHKASKRTKTFETQKVVKKLKDLRKKGDNTQTIGEYETELTYLKGTDHDSIGNTALKTKLLKDRTLRENEDIMAAMNKELEGSLVVLAEPGTTIAKIQSRLLSSKFLSMQVATSLEALRVLLNPASRQNKAEDHAHASSDKVEERPSKLRKEALMSNIHVTNSTAPKLDGADQDVDMTGWESGSIDEVEEPDDDSGWESGDIGPDNALEDEDASNRESESKFKPKSTPAKPPLSKHESTFLPSLSVGFIRGGSDDSDRSDTEVEPRKNRRGQRARRAIWEKKFGRNAHHKKKEEATNAQARKINGHTSKITGSNTQPRHPSATKGSAHRSEDKSLSQIHYPVDSGWTGRKVAVSSAKVVTAASTDQPLHPSWEAKRRLKEKESIGIVASQGKKIKF